MIRERKMTTDKSDTGLYEKGNKKNCKGHSIKE